MKKIKIILATLILALLLPSCENDGGTSKIGYSSNGAVPNIQKIAGSDSSINLVAVNNGNLIHLGFTVDKAIGDITSMNIIGFYTKANGTIYKATLVSNVTTFPASFNITQTDLFNAFAELNSASDIQLGDQLKITAELTLKDGSVQKIINDDGSDNFSSNIATSNRYKVQQTYDVSCPINDSSLFNGNYKVVKDSWADYAVDASVPVVAIANTYKFRILSTNNPYLVNPGTSYMEVTIDPSDNSVTVQSNEDFNYGGGFKVPVTGKGVIGSCNGDINLTLDFGTYVDNVFKLVKAP